MFNHDSLKVKDNISRILINSLPVFDKVISTKKYDLIYIKNMVYIIFPLLKMQSQQKLLKVI